MALTFDTHEMRDALVREAAGISCGGSIDDWIVEQIIDCGDLDAVRVIVVVQDAAHEAVWRTEVFREVDLHVTWVIHSLLPVLEAVGRLPPVYVRFRLSSEHRVRTGTVPEA